MFSRILFARALVVLVAITSLAGLSACSERPARFTNTDITGSALVARFSLKDLQGETRTLESYQGKVVAMFFGYTHCPDVCPITLQQWAQVKAELGELGNNLQVIFVTVDPERDTPELLAKYVPRFDPTFQALHGTQDDLKPLLAGLKVYAQKVQNSKGDGYLMDHTAASFVFDQQGRTRLLVRHNADIKPVVADVRQILQGK